MENICLTKEVPSKIFARPRQRSLLHLNSYSKTKPCDLSVAIHSNAPPTPVLTADDVVPVSHTLFQVSEQHFTEAFNASRKKR
ncbi:hypothetical protein KIN20_033146 [Parelaphostrongylus tenuis]|uniref:Uncharacterized protein n=1 Tax=Parelaphostrongylus tenuis TaxID=148309 RepID=A0AAD5R858_PARTN|nr:hypothetical protein KIN20_033146 [Parelaphostrongylus tenuis]